jgi:hypothetical protein
MSQIDKTQIDKKRIYQKKIDETKIDRAQMNRVPAKSFFADLLLPLKYANTRRNVHYFVLVASQPSYWQPVISRTGGLEKLSATGSRGSALLELLGKYWNTQNDSNLPKLLPYLVTLRQELVESLPPGDEPEPRLTEFVYPIF